MKKNIIIIIIFIISVNNAFTQERFIPPSPQNISEIKGSNQSINLYTGQADINIPILSVNYRNLSTDILLKYTGGSGIKIQEIAGNAGLGWNLSAGGVITCVVKSNNQEENISSYANWLLSPIGSSDFSKAFTLTKVSYTQSVGANLELDDFRSSIGGRILFDRNKIPFFTKENGFKIEKNGVYAPDHEWIITDAKGNLYYFGRSIQDRERSVYYSLDNGVVTSVINPNIVIAWHLTEIKSPDGASIQFEYEKSGQIIESAYYENSKTVVVDDGHQEVSFQDSTRNSYEEIHLKKIKTADKTITFSYVDRLDLKGGKAIAAIDLLDENQSFVGKYVFETDYFKNGINNPPLRLRLNAIKHYGKQMDRTNLIAAFSYNMSENLPVRLSKQYDHWGYYNNNTIPSAFVSDGAIKMADFQKCQANILKKINWPTGGSTEFEYELNSYVYNNELINGGGLRIKAITQLTSNNVPYITKYSYLNDQGVSSGLSNLLYDSRNGYSSYYNSYNMGTTVSVVTENTSPIRKTIDLDGVSIGYSVASVEHPDHSIEKFYFQDFAEFPDQVSVFSFSNYPLNVENFKSIAYHPTDHSGLSLFSSNAIQRGLLKEKHLIDGNGKLLEKNVNFYNRFLVKEIPASQVITVASFVISDSTPEPGYFKYSSLYMERSEAVRLIKSISYRYESNFSNPIVSISRNEYSAYNYPYLITKNISSASSTDSLITEYHYPFEFGTTNAMSAMVSNNIIIPVETINKISKNNVSYVIGAKLDFYQEIGNNYIVPQSSKILETSGGITDYQPLSVGGNYDSRFKTNVSFTNYGAKGELVQFNRTFHPPTTNIWDNSGSVILAIVKNATLDQIIFENSETVYGSHLWDQGIRDIVVNDGYTGQNSLRVSEISKTLPFGFYNLSYRFKGMPLTLSGATINNVNISKEDARGWKTLTANFSLSGQTKISMIGNANSSLLIDDICVIPSDAEIEYTTQQPFRGMTSITDTKNFTKFYDYDDFNRLRSIKDHQFNMLKTINYNYVNNANWQNEGAKICITNSYGYNTGEAQCLQRDVNPISLSYNQTKMQYMGYDYSCLPVFYAKFIWGTTSAWLGTGGIQQQVRGYTIKLYYDQACTIPANFDLDIDLKMKVSASGYCGNTSTIEDYKFHGSTYNSTVVIGERNDLDTPGTWSYCNYSYQFQNSSQYIIVP